MNTEVDNLEMYKKILVAVDFSENSHKAVLKAKNMANRCGADIELIHVVEIPTYPILEDIAVMGMPGIWDEEIGRTLIEVSNKKLQSLAQQFDISDYRTIEGLPSSDIVKYAEQRQSDLIVMGTHGASGLKALIGSTANSVINHAKCDVLAVKL
ncbi:universal stress protein [Thiomicrorhabdus immobilis]|uniref:Universal stress protein n=1 Tax=Thiomicrorhabdus immobilis TaxID=2791037 RepID=A0ABN6CWN0_9GAMM|nr:universal stress protein [Thiomicrorhabdus immobilis]BCN93425.1 universal stress protein [Thiomicrorhabdus immobilis]